MDRGYPRDAAPSLHSRQRQRRSIRTRAKVQPFNAAWTLGSIKYLAEAGANSITYYELAGKGGILGFPVEKVFASIKGADGILPSQSSDPLRVDAAVFTRGSERQVVLANMTNRTQRARLSGKTLELAPHEIRSL